MSCTRAVLKSLPIMLPAFFSSAAFAAYNNNTHWNQIKWAPSYNVVINGTSQTITPTGAGITVGVIDTGATPGWVGNVPNSIVMGNCQIAGCTSSADNHGHGTFIASEIASRIPSIGMTGLANGAKVLAVKVLGANGSGTSTDVSKGIIYAANNGAQVLNLSLGPSGTASQQAAFYSSIASAVNYAASKGVMVVFAGGNAAQSLAVGSNITGFSDAALQRMLFVGSVNANNGLSSFSNTPGSAGFISTSGKLYAYNKMWVMADGEGLWGASNYYTTQAGYGYITQMSGTSMAAPQAAAALALLESQWAILRTNGSAAQLLAVTSSDLGTKGVDNSYGYGLMNLTQAMQPYGTLTVNQANGKSVSLSSVTGNIVLGGAFGATSNGKLSTGLQKILSNYTTFDGFGRNYSVNLANLVTGASASSMVSQSVSAPKTTSTVARFADGTHLAFGSSSGSDDLASRPKGMGTHGNWFMSFTDVSGSTIAAGHGMSSSASFTNALWGDENPAAGSIATLGASTALSNLAQGGSFLAYGTRLNPETRLALSWSNTASSDGLSGPAGANPSAMAVNAGLSHRITDNWTSGITLGTLGQQHGLLDATYSGEGLSLGEDHQSFALGVTSGIALSDTQTLVFDAAITRTNGAAITEGLITNVSKMYARSLGAAYVQKDTFQSGDNLNLSLRAPLRVFSGSVSMLTSTVDEDGLPITTTQRISMAPSGHEVSLGFNYQAPVNDEGVSWGFQAEARRDVNNIAGQNDVSLLATAKLVF